MTEFARISFEKGDYELSLFLFNELTLIAPDNQYAWCMLGNAPFHKDLFNAALNSYEKANELAKAKEVWIMGNIGNLHNNRGLFYRAETILQKASNVYENSEYGLARLTDAYKSIEEEKKKMAEIIAAGKSKLSNDTLLIVIS